MRVPDWSGKETVVLKWLSVMWNRLSIWERYARVRSSIPSGNAQILRVSSVHRRCCSLEALSWGDGEESRCQFSKLPLVQGAKSVKLKYMDNYTQTHFQKAANATLPPCLSVLKQMWWPLKSVDNTPCILQPPAICGAAWLLWSVPGTIVCSGEIQFLWVYLKFQEIKSTLKPNVLEESLQNMIVLRKKDTHCFQRIKGLHKCCMPHK